MRWISFYIFFSIISPEILVSEQEVEIKQIKLNNKAVLVRIRHGSEQRAPTYSLSRWAWGSVVTRCALQNKKKPTASY